MSRIKSRAVRISGRVSGKSPGKRLVVLPKPQKNWLLAGTALVTGVVIAGFAGGIATSTPAAAECAITNTSGGPEDLGYYDVSCSGYTQDSQDYDAGSPPANSASKEFDADLHLTTVAPTFIDTAGNDWDGIDINATTGGDNGYSVEVLLNDKTVINAETEGVQVRTNDYFGDDDDDDDDDDIGNIDITSNGYIQTQESGNAGIFAESESGYINITNNGTIGLGFIDGLTLEDGVFKDGPDGAEVAFVSPTESNSAFYVAPDLSNLGVGGTGIYAYSSDGGTIHAINNGTIFAKEWGIELESNGGTVIAENHSYLSNISVDSATYLHDSDAAFFNNQGGLNVSLENEGVQVDDITGFDSKSYLGHDNVAVGIDNTEGGIIAGYWDGIDINDVWSNDVVIDNAGWFEDVDGLLVPHAGGLIVGVHGEGIDITEADGNVIIYNENTYAGGAGGLDFAMVDPYAGLTKESGGVLGEPQYQAHVIGSTGSNGDWLGIWGYTNGIELTEIGEPENDYDGHAEIYNDFGIVVGVTNDGIRIRDIAASEVEGEYGYYELSALITNTSGLIWGGDDAIDIANNSGPDDDDDDDDYYGDIIIDNSGYSVPSTVLSLVGDDDDYGYEWVSGGAIIGGDKAIRLRNVGNVDIYNDGGLIQGWWGDAIDIEGAGHVTIDSGWDVYHDGFGYVGGTILSHDSAVRLRDVYSAWIGNGEDGLVIGEGSWNQAVFDIRTSSGPFGGAVILNDENAIMSSENLPYFSFDPWSGDAATIPTYKSDIGYNWSDVDDLWEYVESAGTDGYIGYQSDYSEAASDVLVKSWSWNVDDDDDDHGSVEVDNYGLMIGRVVANGSNVFPKCNLDDDDCDDYAPMPPYGYYGGDIGNTVINYNTWMTRNSGDSGGWGGYGNVLDGDGYDAVYNLGLIQTAHDDQEGEYTSFDVDGFYNGGYNPYGYQMVYDLVADDDDDDYEEMFYGGTGILSMMDGAEGDVTDIKYGSFFGGYEPEQSLLAVDVYLDNEYGDGESDELWLTGDYKIAGTTGIVIHKTNEMAAGYNYRGIDIVEYSNYDVYNGCGDGPCEAGDAFYISPLSNGYFEAGGVGMIEDGLFAWSLWQDDDYKDFELIGHAGPGALNAPRLLTGAQDIFYATLGQIPGSTGETSGTGAGGGGADLATDYVAPDYTAPAASNDGTRTGIWAKASGTWTERDTTVNAGFGDVDTSSNQDIYSVLGGADMKPGGVDSPFRLGLFGGYVSSNLDFDLGTGSSVDYEGGVVGGYAAYNNGTFYVDATVKGDFLSSTYSFSGLDVDADVNSVGVAANTGYRLSMGSGFVEPIASVTYVNTEVDNISGGGGTVNFSNGTSFRAGAGARVGAKMGMAELSFLGKVWNEFEGDNTVTVTDGITTETYTDDTSGVFGEASATLAVSNASGTLSGFLTGGGEFGEDFTSWNAQAGIRAGF